MQASSADPMPPPLRLRLFGPFEVWVDGRPLPRLRSRKSLWLLALLALRREAEVEREWLAGLLWPERVDSQALRNSLTELRRALGPRAERLRSPTAHTLSLDLSGAEVDLITFDFATARGDPAALNEAVALYRGPLLEGCTEEWAFQERQTREQAYVTALERLAAHALEAKDAATAEAHLRRAAAVDPLRESTHRALMQALAAGGNYASALLCYRELRLRLHHELNAEPDPATRVLFQQIRAEARRLQEDPGARPRPLLTTPVRSASVPRVLSPSVALATPPVREAVVSNTDSAPAGAPSIGENRLVSVLFADMSRSVETTHVMDSEEAAALVNRLLGIMVEAILKFGGQVDRFLGDGLLALFGTPQAHEDDAERAVRAALEIREAAARMSHPVTIGINTGTVYVGAIGPERHQETTVVGPVVNLASRLQEQADEGQILVGEATYHLTRLAFRFSSRSLTVRGIAEPVTAYSVAQALARPQKARGIEGLLTPLVGREEELAKLQAALTNLLPSDSPGSNPGAAVRGQIVSLIGEAGAGKSRLISELKAAGSSRLTAHGSEHPSHHREHRPLHGHPIVSHEPSPLWLEGRCLELAVTDRYSLFVDLLRHYFAWPDEEDDAGRVVRIAAALRDCAAHGALTAARAEEIGPFLADLLSLRWGDDGDLRMKNTDPEQRKQQTLLAIRDFLLALARQRPVVLALEDLHWADSLSLDLLSLLMETLAPVPLLLLCSYRPDREYRCSRLGAIAAQKCPECYTELHLRDLTPTQSQQLVASLLGARELPMAVQELVLDRSRGNPFFTEEVVYSLLDGGVLYQEDGAWRVREERGRPRVPEGIQGVILSRVDRLDSDLRRVLQHAAVIGRVFPRRLLEVAAGESTQLERRLWELEERGLIYQERVIPEEEYSFRHVLMQETIYEGILRSQRAPIHRHVAEAIESLYADRIDAYYKQLAFHYERCGLDEATQELALSFLIRAAERAHRVAGHREEAALLAQAQTIAERLGRSGRVTELHARRGTALSRIGEWSAARAELETALAQLPSDRTEARAEILIDLAGICFWGVEGPRVRPYATEGRALAEAAHRDDLAGTALAWLAVADQMDGDLRASVKRYAQAMERAGGFRTAPVIANAPLTRYLLGEYRAAVDLAGEAVASIRGLNNTSATMFAMSHLGLALAATGRYSESMTIFEEARQYGIEYEVGHFVARATAMSAGLHLDVYDYDGLEERAEEAREMARRASFAPTVVSAGIDLLLSYARRAEIGRAERLVDEVNEQAAQVAGWHGWLWGLRLAQARAEIALARGDWEQAERAAEDAIEQSRRRGRVKYEVAGLLTRGQALAAQGLCPAAIRDIRGAVVLARPVGDPAMLLRAAAVLLPLDGDGDLAAEARSAAKRILAALPDGPMRRRFEAAEPVRLLGSLA